MSTPVWTRNIRSYIELESSLGVLPSGSPDKRLLAWSVRPQPKINKSEIRPLGNIFRSGYQSGLEWTDIEAVAGEGADLAVDFNGINYALASIFGNVSPTNPGVGVYKRVFNPASTPATFGLDYGSPGEILQRVLGCFFTQIGFNANLNSLTFSASGKGRRIASGVTGAASPADVALVKPNGFRGGLYLNTTYGSLGTPGDVGKIVSGSFLSGFRGWSIDTGNLYDVDTTIKPTNLSWDRPKPLSADGSASVILDGNTGSWAYLTQVRSNATVYGLYEVIDTDNPIVAGTAEVQTLDLSGDDDPTGGTWDLSILGTSITSVAWNVSAAALQALINALSVFGADEVTVGKVGFIYTITYPAKLGNVAQATGDATNLTGGVGDTFAITAATTTPGVAALNYYFAVEWAGQFSDNFSLSDQEGSSVIELPFGLVQDSNVTGIRVTTQCGIADLAA